MYLEPCHMVSPVIKGGVLISLVAFYVAKTMHSTNFMGVILHTSLIDVDGTLLIIRVPQNI